MKQSVCSSPFDELLETPVNRLVEQAIDERMVPIGYTCSYVPVPLLSVGNLFPLRLRAQGLAGTELADTYMSNVICSYTKSLFENALTGNYAHLGGWIFTSGCDHMRRLMDNLEYAGKPAFSHLLDVPHKSGESAVDKFRKELRVLAGRLGDRFGVDVSDGSLASAIRARNRFADVIRSIGELRKNDPPVITGGEFHRLMLASMAAPRHLLAPILSDFSGILLDRRDIGQYRARIMIAGGELDDLSFIDVIESQGGLVVADRFCTGSIPGLGMISESGDPLQSMAEHALRKTLCPRMMDDFAKRLAAIKNTALEYRADGVIIQSIKFCDTWGIECSSLTSELRSAGIHVLRLEREYRHSGEGQLRTRVQAFIESMGK